MHYLMATPRTTRTMINPGRAWAPTCIRLCECASHAVHRHTHTNPHTQTQRRACACAYAFTYANANASSRMPMRKRAPNEHAHTRIQYSRACATVLIRISRPMNKYMAQAHAQAQGRTAPIQYAHTRPDTYAHMMQTPMRATLHAKRAHSHPLAQARAYARMRVSICVRIPVRLCAH